MAPGMDFPFRRGYGAGLKGGVGDFERGPLVIQRGRAYPVASPGAAPGYDTRVIEPEDIHDLHSWQPIRGDFLIDVGTQVTLAASASRSEIRVYQADPGTQAIIRFLGCALANTSDYSAVTWSVLLNGQEISGLGRWIGLKSASITAMMPIRVDMNPMDRISVIASNSTTAAITGCSARLYGWGWSARLRG